MSLENELVFERRFQVWLYTVSHRQLLLRSTERSIGDSQIDILFGGVQAISLPTLMENIGVSPLLSTPGGPARKFKVRWSGGRGYVIAAEIKWQEWRGSYYEDSPLMPRPRDLLKGMKEAQPRTSKDSEP